MFRQNIITIIISLLTASQLNAVQILLPLYNYPNWYDAPNYVWDDVASAGSKVSITAVINPNNGPGIGGPNADYTRGINDLAAGGVRMVGYVFTNYGARLISDIKADIDNYATNFTNISGIFFDEASTDLTKLAYYKEIHDYALTKSQFNQVFTNPGVQIPESFLKTPTVTAETSVIFENQTGWNTYATDSYVAGLNPNKTAAIIYNVPTFAQAKSAIDLTVQRNIGYVYVTNDILPNPYDSIPSYWLEEVNYIASIPESSTFLLSLLSVGFIVVKRRRPAQ
jgi:Spherulation-specific family 4